MGQIVERVECEELRDKITDPIDAIRKFVPKKGTIALSGLAQMSSPKLIPLCLAEYVKGTGERFEFNLYCGGSAAPELDGALAGINAIKRRYPYQNNPVLRDKIHEGVTEYLDIHLSRFPQILRYGFLDEVCGPIDLAIVEATVIKSNGGVVPTLSVDITPTILQLAKKVIVEVNVACPREFEGFHDIHIPENPPMRSVIPITKVNQRIGTPYAPCSSEKVVAIVESSLPESEVLYGQPTSTESKIVENLLDFLVTEVRTGRLPKNLLPLQTGIGPMGDTIASGLVESDFEHLLAWTEVVQMSYIDLIDAGKLDFASGTCLYIPPHEKRRRENFMSHLEDYKNHIVLRPVDITNSHEVVGRLGVISMNQAVEIDIYGFVNSTHVLGGKVINGIGGAAEFARDAYISIFLATSTTKNDRISRIVPMVTHVDVADHDVDIIVTEHGWADLRGRSPKERAKDIIERCAHPDYEDMLSTYFRRACEKTNGHMPHMLSEAYLPHLRYAESGSMKY